MGNCPASNSSIDLLEQNGIKNILALCSESEIKWVLKTSETFSCKRIYIPDSKSNALPTYDELYEINDQLSKYIKKGATFIHCLASVERSPLVCILYVMQKFNLEIEDSLDYVLRKHKYTNPTNAQLKLIKDFNKKLRSN